MNAVGKISAIWILVLFFYGCGGGGGGEKPDTEPPVWVDTVGITQAVPGPGSATIFWGKAEDRNGVVYKIYVATHESPWENGIGFVELENNNPVTITGLIVGQTYWFAVRARDIPHRVPSRNVMAASIIPLDNFKNQSKSTKTMKDSRGMLIAMGPPEPPILSYEDYNTQVLSVTPVEPGNFRMRSWGDYLAYSHAVKVDHLGNVYIAGDFRSTADFNSGTSSPVSITSKGDRDAFISKFNPLGQLEWVRILGGAYGESAYDIAIDSSDSIYITGIFSGEVDFDPMEGTDLHVSNAWYDIFLLKLNGDGTKVWANTWGGGGQDVSYRICFDPTAGCIIVTGGFSNTVDFDPGPGEILITSTGTTDAFYSKFDLNGNLLKSGTWNINPLAVLDPGEILTAIGCDTMSNIYLAGRFQSTTDLNPGPDVNEHISNGLSDAYLMKLDQDGNYIWSKSFGGQFNDSVEDLAVDSSGNVYAAGNYLGPIDFAQGSGGGSEYSSSGETDVFLTRFDPDGNIKWVKTWGGASSDTVSRIKCDASGNIYALSGLKSTVHFNPSQGQEIIPLHDGYDNIYVCKFNPQGNLIRIYSWCNGTQYYSQGKVYGLGLDIDAMSNISISGAFKDNLDFDTSDGICIHYSGSGDWFTANAKAFVMTVNPEY